MGFARYITFVTELDYYDGELPQHLMRALRSRGLDIPEQSMREDEGWAFPFRYAGEAYQFCSRSELGEPLQCMGWLERDVGVWASWFGPRETNNYPELEPILQSALAGLPGVRDVAWRAGDEDSAAE